MGILSWITKRFIKSEQQRIEEYLAKSTDLVDLERRQRQLQFGKTDHFIGNNKGAW